MLPQNAAAANRCRAYCRHGAARVAPRLARQLRDFYSHRLEGAVEYHFETTQRPKCAIVEERELTPIHHEFVYACRP